MLSGTMDIMLALILVIPFHGIYLSMFFFIHSKWHLNANSLMGLLLLMVSCLSFSQSFYSPSSFPALYEYRCENCYDLLLCPILYLYNRTVIYPEVKGRFLKHFMNIFLNWLLIIFSACLNELTHTAIIVLVAILNGLYLGGSFCLIIGAIRKKASGYTGLLISKYSGIIILNLLVTGAILVNTLNYMMHSAVAFYFIQFTKALIIYYTYYRILALSDRNI